MMGTYARYQAPRKKRICTVRGVSTHELLLKIVATADLGVSCYVDVDFVVVDVVVGVWVVVDS